ncbi:MAG TPA: hypothetical protein VEQ66_15220 [Propionibacteriaceae bacterium]|nr:hypothetical protein [Propionibacteriaceae bacterium]
MRPRVARRWLSSTLAIILGLLGALTVAPAEATAFDRGRALTVMTRNIYVGGDITRPFRAVRGLTGWPALLALGHANHELRTIVDRTDFGVRSRLLAREIARAAPDVIGLQEVALWRSGPMELNRLGVTNATAVDYDFLAMLLHQLRAHHSPYRLASEQQASDVEAPAFLGDPRLGTAKQPRDVRLTVRDVILVRQHGGVRVSDRGGAQYKARINVEVGGAAQQIVRGYTWADIHVRSRRIRFVNTHLESQSADLALAQARELLASSAMRAPKTLLVCDCNSDPLADSVRPGSTVPYSAAYRLLTGSSGGFRDLWLRQRRPGPGLTAVLSELVNDQSAAALDRRLDLVLARTPQWRRLPEVVRARVTGDQLRDRDRRTGLWPSDHAGVAIRLRLR